jgi:hypothetical protein
MLNDIIEMTQSTSYFPTRLRDMLLLNAARLKSVTMGVTRDGRIANKPSIRDKYLFPLRIQSN